MPNAPREARYLRWALNDALAQSAIRNPQSTISPSRFGLILGTTLHGIRQGGQYLRTGEVHHLEHFLAAAVLKDVLTGLPISGPALTTCSACSSGLAAIALGVTLLQSGKLDLVIAGGYDPVSEYVYAGFDSLRLVAEGDARPFAKGRDGMKVAEGYALLTLEREQDALARQSAILARVLGYGETSDSHHLTQPHPEGEGAARAAAAALSMAGIAPATISLVSAHATSTPNNDAAEFAALSRIFPDRITDTPVVGFKSHIGHTLGGAGAAELILSAMALRDQVFPPTANTTPQDLEFPLRLNLDGPEKSRIDATLNMSLGFGGSNAAMILGRTRDTKTPPGVRGVPAQRPVLITGVGIVTPAAVGNQAFINLLTSDHAPSDAPSHLDDAQIAHLLQARRVRRMSEYVKVTLAATAVACQDASITDIPAFAATAAAMLGTCLGSTSFCESYYRPITREGLSAANPMLFAEGVPNAAAAQLSMMFQVKGPCQTIIGSRTAGLDALSLAALRIASGEWDRAIVSAGEEFHETAIDVYKGLGLYAGAAPTKRAPRGFTLSTGAVTFILESESSAQGRGVKPRVFIEPSIGGSAQSPRDLTRVLRGLAHDFDKPATVVHSFNGTWLDRIEAAAARASNQDVKPFTLERRLPELLSAAPLAGLAAAILCPQITGHIPSVCILAADYAGLAAALHVKLAHTSG
jgi:3-oxoacyl-[acyl-carrier-protein] synthase II